MIQLKKHQKHQMAVETVRIESIRIVFLTVLLLNTVSAQNDCRQTRCGRHGPIIRFPFQLKNEEQPQEGCGYPGFFLFCTDDHDTVLKLPANPQVQLSVRSINYASQVLELYDSQNCLPEKLIQLLNSSTNPFTIGSPSPNIAHHEITFFNCSSSGFEYLRKFPSDGPISSKVQDMHSCPIYAAPEYNSFDVTDLIFCAKMLNITRVVYGNYDDDVDYVAPYFTGMSSLFLFWESPNCTKCELQEKNCKLKNNGTMGETECFQLHKHRPRPWIAIGSVTGLITIVLVVSVVYRVQKFYKMLAEDEVRVEKFLEDYRVLKPTRFSYVDIKRVTKGFTEKLGEGAHGTVFKGKLSSDIVVAVKMLNNSKGDGQEFINEVGIMGKIHHVNVIRLVGFCADGHHRALVYDFYPLGSLQNFISLHDDRSIFLGWEKLHGIALGIAKGIEYLHMGCEQRILHFDINPHNVLLDNNYTPKITDFGLAKLCSRDRSTVSVTAAKGTLGYIAPEVFSRNFGNGNVSYKSDVYSYGMLLLEMVGGRKNMEQTAEDVFHVLYPEWIHNLLEGKDIHIHIDNEEDIEIAKRLATVGLWCIQWHPVDRPSMTTVVQMLEGEGGKLTMPPNPLDKTTRARTKSNVVPRRRLNSELEVIQESV